MLSPRQIELDNLHFAQVPLPSLYWAMFLTLPPLLLLSYMLMYNQLKTSD